MALSSRNITYDKNVIIQKIGARRRLAESDSKPDSEAAWPPARLIQGTDEQGRDSA